MTKLMYPTRWSYSAYGCHSECPYKYFKLHVERMKRPPSPAMDRGIRIHALAENYLKGKIQGMPNALISFSKHFKGLKAHKPVVEEFWGVDNKWRFVSDKDKTWCVMKMDAAVKPEDGVLSIIDHKTGHEYPNHEDQGSLYATIGWKKFPKIKSALVEFWYLDMNSVSTFEYTVKDLKLLQGVWDRRGKKLMADRQFTKTPSEQACKYCPARSDKGGDCKAWRNI